MHAPSRTLLTGGRSRKRTASRPNRAATSSPAKAAQSRLRDKTAAASPRRPAVVREAPAEPNRATEDLPPLRLMDDGILADAYTAAMAADDQERIEQIERELDRRDRADSGEVDEEAAQAFLDSLAGKPRMSQREQAKEAYREWVYATAMRAEAEAGQLHSKEGIKAGINETSFFDGTLRRNQIKMYAAEELLRWFAQPGNQRMTETEFVKQWEGRFTVADQDRRNQPLSEFG